MHGSFQEYKEGSRSRSPSVSTDTSSNDYIEEYSLIEKESDNLHTRFPTQRKTPCILPRLKEFNIYFDKYDSPEFEVKRDIHAQLLVQVSSLNNTKLSQLVNEIYEVVLEMQKKRANYRWWTDSQGRDWRLSTRSTTKKDK